MAGPLTVLTAPNIAISGGGGSEGGEGGTPGAPTLSLDRTEVSTYNQLWGPAGSTQSQYPVTVTVLGGIGPFTYEWVRKSGSTDIYVDSPSDYSTYFTFYPSGGGSTYEETSTWSVFVVGPDTEVHESADVAITFIIEQV